MESFFSRYKNALVLIVVLVAQLLALAVQVKRPAPGSPDQEGVSLIRYVVVSVITPPERLLHNAGLWIRGIWTGYFDLVHVRREDAELKAQIERLRLEQASLAEDARQGQRLSELLSFQQTYIYRTVPAQVIGASGTEQSRTLYIDKGLKDGLAPDMPVVTADGIVGRLRDVFDHKSLVLLVSDPTSGVGVVLESTRTRGILKGVSFGELQVINVSPDDRIKPGERIVTSGGDQIFPRGLPVGTVEQVSPDPDRDPLVDLAVHPAANLSRLEEVLVITDVGETPSRKAQRDLADSEAEGLEEKKRASDVLAERLPSRLDAKAPADTNPDPKVGDASGVSTADEVRLMTPPKPLRPDQYSPEATPGASELTPGQRRAPLLQGTEDVAAPAKRNVSAATSTDTGAATGAGGETKKTVTTSGNSISGAARTTAASTTTGSTTRPAGTGTVPGSSATGLTATTPKPRPATALDGSTSTSVSRPATGTGAAGTSTAGTTPVTPKPRPATGTSLTGGTGAGTTSSVTRSTATGTTPNSGSGTTPTAPKRTVIVDGPSPAGRTATTSRPADSTATPSTVPVKKKAPELVPDDGSRPPAPKPKPAQPSGDNAAAPNGRR